jgi:hypothetical protein
MAPKTLKQSSRDSDEEPCPHAAIALDVISRAGAAELHRSRKVEGRIQPVPDLDLGFRQRRKWKARRGVLPCICAWSSVRGSKRIRAVIEQFEHFKKNCY